MTVSQSLPRLRSTSAAAPNALAQAMRGAAQQGATALSEMTGRSITAEAVGLRTVPLAGLSTLAGDPERPVVAIHLGVGGDGSGCILLALGEAAAYELVDMLLGQPDGTTEALDEFASRTDLADATRRKIVWDNPLRLYGLDPARLAQPTRGATAVA